VTPGLLPSGFVAIDLAHDLGLKLYDPNDNNAPLGPGRIQSKQRRAAGPTIRPSRRAIGGRPTAAPT
jgi:hypothetical protein